MLMMHGLCRCRFTKRPANAADVRPLRAQFYTVDDAWSLRVQFHAEAD